MNCAQLHGSGVAVGMGEGVAVGDGRGSGVGACVGRDGMFVAVDQRVGGEGAAPTACAVAVSAICVCNGLRSGVTALGGGWPKVQPTNTMSVSPIARRNQGKGRFMACFLLKKTRWTQQQEQLLGPLYTTFVRHGGSSQSAHQRPLARHSLREGVEEGLNVRFGGAAPQGHAERAHLPLGRNAHGDQHMGRRLIPTAAG